MDKFTLILPPRYSEDSIALYRAASVEGWQVKRLQGWRIPENFDRERNFAVYGEALFCAVVCDQLNLSLIEPPFSWLSNLPENYTLRKIQSLKFRDALKFNQTAFFKPADDKCFPAKIYKSGNELSAFTSLSETTPVIISEPVKWKVEFRFFITDNEVKTFSPYSRNGELIKNENDEWIATDRENKEAFEFCQKLIEECRENIPPAVVIDIGEIEGRGWAVVEANPCWASGIYGCDSTNVLQVLKRACIKTNQISNANLKWIVKRDD